MSLIMILSLSTLFMMTNYIHLWIMMEINTMLLISLMSMYTKNFKATFNFFMIQSISSIMLIMLMFMKNNFYSYSLFNFLLIMMFSLKLGLFPFHFWPPLINMNLNWMLIFIMSTTQKFIPLLIFYSFFNQINNKMIMNVIITLTISSSLVTTIMNYNETNFKKIMTYSSTNHLSWMIFILLFDLSMFFIYFLIYFLSMIFLCLFFNKIDIKTFFDLNKLHFFNYKKINLIISLNILIISALPPFLTFLIKMNTMKIMIENYSYLSSLTLTLISTFTLIFYMNMIIKINMMEMLKMKYFYCLNFNMKSNFYSSIYVGLLSLTLMFLLFNSIN
uniref:NADH dehydrogenase subunit 2 n=1 Tax=Vespula orbata TaxID=2684586 RepID=UPI0030FDF741